MALQLKLDPTGVETGAKRAKTALDGVKTSAVQAESAIDVLAAGAAADLSRVAPAANKAGKAAQDMARDMAAAGRSSSGMGFQIQNAAFQIGDFAVQVAGGQSATRALAQQLPQLLGGFGVFGAVIGGAVAVAAALAPMLFDIGDGAGTAEENLDNLSEALSTFNTNATLGASTVQQLRDQYGMWASEVRSTAQWMAQVNVGQASEALKVVADAQREEMRGVVAGLVELQDAQRQYDQLVANGMAASNPALGALKGEITRLGEETRLAAEELGLTTDQVVTLSAAFSDMRGAQTMADIQEKSKAALDAIEAMYPAGQQVPPQVAGIAAQFQEVYNQATQGLAVMEDMPAALSGAADAAGGLAGAMGSVAAQAITAMNAMFAMSAAGRARTMIAPLGAGPAGMGSAPPTGGAVLESPRPGMRPIDFDFTAGAAGASGSSGGGATAADRTREAYDRLMASLDPVVAKTQDMAEATKTADAALAAHDITAAEHANALDLIAQKYGETSNAMADLQEVGGNAIDSLIGGTMSLSDALRQMAKDLVFATIKAQLLKSVTGATDSMSLGGLIMAGITGGFHDAGGTIPMGTTGMVGERGPELVRATGGGAVVTSRVDTARMMQGGQNLHVSVGVSVDDDGKVQAYVKRIGQAAAQSGAAQAVQSVRRSLGQWNSDLQRDGALA